MEWSKCGGRASRCFIRLFVAQFFYLVTPAITLLLRLGYHPPGQDFARRSGKGLHRSTWPFPIVRSITTQRKFIANSPSPHNIAAPSTLPHPPTLKTVFFSA
ncbi:unnamed protein product, partial [Scytosiphon promiscuus]